jgi:ankyrin repeat protein
MRKLILCFLGMLSINVSASDVLDMDKAIRSGDLSTVSSLLEKGVSPNVIINEGRNSIWGHSPLILAVKSQNTALVKLLISSGADVDYVNVGSTTALKEAASIDNDTIATLLINAKADVNFIDENEVPILFWAVSKESKKVIPLLINAGANPDEKFNSMFYGKNSVKEYFSKKGKTSSAVLSLLN